MKVKRENNREINEINRLLKSLANIVEFFLSPFHSISFC